MQEHVRFCALVFLISVAIWRDTLVIASNCDSVYPLVGATLDAEISVAQRQVELYRRKAALLRQLIQLSNGTQHSPSLDAEDAKYTQGTSSTKATFNSSKQRSRRQRRSKSNKGSSSRLLEDWFSLQDEWKLANDTRGGMWSDLITFKPHGSLAPRKMMHQYRYTATRTSVKLQYVLQLDLSTGRSKFLDPSTMHVIWEHHFDLHDIVDIVVSSEKSIRIALLSRTGSIVVHKLRLFQNRRVIAGEFRRFQENDIPRCLMRSSHVSPLSPLYPWQDEASLLSQSDHSRVLPRRSSPPKGNHVHFEFERTAAITLPPTPAKLRAQRFAKPAHLFAIVPLQHHSAHLIIADPVACRLRCFDATNGSHVYDAPFPDEFQSPNDQERDLHLHAFSPGLLGMVRRNQVYFWDALRRQWKSTVCHGTMSPIASIERDSWRGSQFYAGTYDGHILVFRWHRSTALDATRMSAGHVKANACILIQQLTPRYRVPTRDTAQASLTIVRSFPGYLIAATPVCIALYDTASDARVSMVADAPLRSMSAPKLALDDPEQPSLQIVALTIARDLALNPIALAVIIEDNTSPSCRAAMTSSSVACPSLRMDLYASALVAPHSTMDFAWLRLPLMVLCAIAVIYWQQRQKQAQVPATSPASPFFPAARSY